VASVITTTVDPTYARIGVTLTGFPSDDPTTVWRVPVEGGVAQAVRGASPMNLIAGVGFQWDYEASSGVAYRYVANDGAADVQSTPVTMTLAEAHIVAVGRPNYNLAVLPEAVPETTRRARGELAQIIGRRNPVALTDVRAGLEASLTLLTVNDDESDALEEVLVEAQILFMQLPGSRFGARYVLVGDVTETPYTGIRGADEGAVWSLDLTEVDRPGGDVSGDPLVDYQLLVDAVQSFGALLLAADTYLELRAGVGLDPDVAVPLYVGPFGATATGASSAVATLPAFVAGDLAIGLLGLSDNTRAFTIPSGWTQVGTDLTSGTARFALVQKVLAADTTVTLTNTGGTCQKVVAGAVYRNAVMNAGLTTRQAGASSSVTATSPASSTTIAGSVALRLFSALSATANASWSLPAGHTQRRSELGSGATSMSAFVIDQNTGQPGTVLAATSNRSVASASFAGWTVVIQTP
jgi:hypothetical protein